MIEKNIVIKNKSQIDYLKKQMVNQNYDYRLLITPKGEYWIDRFLQQQNGQTVLSIRVKKLNVTINYEKYSPNTQRFS